MYTFSLSTYICVQLIEIWKVCTFVILFRSNIKVSTPDCKIAILPLSVIFISKIWVLADNYVFFINMELFKSTNCKFPSKSPAAMYKFFKFSITEISEGK